MSFTEAQKKARKNYRAKCKQFTLEFYPKDLELFEHLQKQPQKQAFIKELIRKSLQESN